MESLTTMDAEPPQTPKEDRQLAIGAVVIYLVGAVGVAAALVVNGLF